MLFGVARLVALILIAWVVLRSPLRRGTHVSSPGEQVISDRQLVIMCAVMAGVLVLGVLFQRFH